MSFETLKRNRGSNITKIIQAAEATNSGETKSYVDERMWKPTVDKAGNGYSVLRFLPGKDGEIPFVRYWDHGFKGPTGLWYIENSLTSVGQPDPVGELNSKLWNSGIESDKEKARTQKRRLHYVTNIYVVSDPSNPANEGKVFLYKFGKKIFDKIYDLMNPAFADEKPTDPFDFWEGADFKLKIRNVEGYRNYDKSEFASTASLVDGDEAKLEEIWNAQYSLNEIIEEKNFKNYAELEARFNTVIARVDHDSSPEFVGNIEESTGDKVAPSEKTDDTLDYFKKLAEQE
jgi:hypothetical protein